MRVFRVVLAYDGTKFHGWQVQPRSRTVQGVVIQALATALGHDPSPIHAAGRTDAGVHARGQVASFASDTALPPRAIAARLGHALPRDVQVREVVEERPGFHARHSARARRYAYWLLREDDVLFSRIAWRPPFPFDPDALVRATSPLEGVHDFSSFRSSGSTPSDPKCRMMRASWSAWERGVRLDIAADHFLYHMVRNVVGTALEAARAPDPAAEMRAVIAAHDRSAAGPTAPPQGLSLEEVSYDEVGA